MLYDHNQYQAQNKKQPSRNGTAQKIRQYHLTELLQTGWGTVEWSVSLHKQTIIHHLGISNYKEEITTPIRKYLKHLHSPWCTDGMLTEKKIQW